MPPWYRKKKRKRRPGYRKPELSVAQILAAADLYHERTGRWPKATGCGRSPGLLGDTWTAISVALRQGHRGLPGGSSLAQLLAEHRGVRNKKRLPRFRIPQILAWADAYHHRYGVWPTKNSGPIAEAPGEAWATVDAALYIGFRGLAGGSSLTQLLHARRGVRKQPYLPSFTRKQVLRLATAHYRRTGNWPTQHSGPIPEMPGDNWRMVDHALRLGFRGLPGGSSLAQLLEEEGHVRNRAKLPAWNLKQILTWIDHHYQRTGQWPKSNSGPIPQSPGDTWGHVDDALYKGLRGLPGGSSLPRLLEERRGVRNQAHLPRLTYKLIRAWAETHYRRTGRYPTRDSGPVVGAPGEKWMCINAALKQGLRGLPGDASLSRLLKTQRRDAKKGNSGRSS